MQQPSLYANFSEPILPPPAVATAPTLLVEPAALLTNKNPWEMTEEEFEAHENRIMYHLRPFVGARDNPFLEPLYGQEAIVYQAIVANERIPADVLDRFEELKEWLETGSSPTIRENEENDRKRKHQLANRPPIGTETTEDEGRRTGCRVIYVDPARLDDGFHNTKRGDIAASYSGDKICNPKSTVGKPFQFENKRYISTGGGGVDESIETYQLVPLAEFKGETTTYNDKLNHNPKDADCEYPGDTARNDPMGFYHGMIVSSAGKPHVMSEPPIIFRPGKVGTEPAGELFKPPSSLAQKVQPAAPTITKPAILTQPETPKRPLDFALYYDSTYQAIALLQIAYDQAADIDAREMISKASAYLRTQALDSIPWKDYPSTPTRSLILSPRGVDPNNISRF